MQLEFTSPHANIDSLIEFLDFQESYTVLLQNKDFISSPILSQIKSFVPDLEKIAEIRNRVMHSRPLLAGDFTHVFTFISKLTPEKRIEWSACKRTFNKLDDDPSFVFTLKIPDETDAMHVFHNLPMPDFDESGFVGRESDCNQVKNLLLGNSRVVSVIGEGGVGKSALILKVAFDIVDMGDKCPFDAIIWSSAKVALLTASGIENIRNTLRDFSGVIGNIAEKLSGRVGSISDNLKEILEYLDEFNVLLIIDNLETITGEEIRMFIREAQKRCKIAITSRVGLGELEFPRTLTGLTEQESAQLIRGIAKVRNSEVLKKLSNKQLANISQQLHFNPLAIKWFVNSVDTGKSPKEVLSNKEDLLNYCFSNVYKQLSDHAKLILKTILSARRPLNDAEVNFLTGLSPLDMRKALNRLFVTTLAKREMPVRSDISECLYSISEFAKSFLLTEHPPSKELVQSVNKKMKQLSGTFEQASLTSNINEFNIKALEIRTQNEKVIARYLHEALKHSHPKRADYDKALKLLSEAKDIVPNYFEIYRISAFVKSSKDDLLGAEEDYKVALELEPDNVRLLFFYSGFLMYQLDDVSAATSYAKKAYDLRPDSPETASLYARCIGYQGKYEQAIELLNNLMNHRTIASVKSRKILSSIMIDFYRRWANTDVEINNDFRSAIHKLRQAMEIFDRAEMASEVDYGTIRDFSEAVFYLLSYSIDSGDEEDKNKVNEILEKYKLYIEQSPYYFKIREIVPGKLGSCYIEGEEKKYTGIVVRCQKTRNFAFISGEAHGELYFNRSAMVNSKEWNNLNEGTKVEYAIGKNFIGECAAKVRVVDQIG